MLQLYRNNPLLDRDREDFLDSALRTIFGSNTRLTNSRGVVNLHQEKSIPINFTEDKETFVIQALLPGLEANDLEISVQEDQVGIIVRKDPKETDEAPVYLMQEFPSTGNMRSIRLPRKVDIESATTTFEGGVLNIVLKKLAGLKVRYLTPK